MVIKKLLAIFAAVLFVAGSTFIASPTVYADPDCSAGKTLTIVAHPDDDLLFVNPKIQQDIDAGKCVETIFVTAGAPAGNTSHMLQREEGIKVAYAYMAGGSGTDSAESISIDGHSAVRYSVTNNPKVSVVFLRIPEPGYLPELWNGDISSVQTVDTAATYTKQGLIDTLHARMAAYKPDAIRTLNFAREIDPTGAADHKDHTATAYFAQAAHYNYTIPHEFSGYVGYEGSAMTANVSGSTLTKKQDTYFAYDAYDSTATSYCSSVTMCTKTSFLAFMERNYPMRTETRSAWNFASLDGDTTATSTYSGDIGKQPASITYGTDLYSFYYDASSQDLRFAKATSSTNPQWTFSTLDSTGNVGINPTAVVEGNKLHVFYYRQDTGDLRHATLNNGSWSFEDLDGHTTSNGRTTNNVGESSTAVMMGTSLQLYYYDSTAGNLRHGWTDSNGWHFEDLDGQTTTNNRKDANLGLDPTAVMYGDSLQLYYYDSQNGNLRHAWTDANGWHFEDLDGYTTTGGHNNADVGINPTAVVYGTTLQLFYYDRDSTNLRHAWSDATGWHFENLEGDKGSVTRHDGNVGMTPSAVVEGTTLHVFHSASDGSLRHVWSSATNGWQAERLDGFGDDGTAGRLTGSLGQDPSAIVYGSKANVFYYDTARGNLRQAILQ